MKDIDPDAHARFIMGVHAASPGLTERSIGAARTEKGLSSYQAFCDFAGPADGMTVVDLACGNGPLGEIVATRIGAHGQLIEVDLSEAELALAAERFRGRANVRLLNESAERLSIADALADLVLCHMAFMLFAPLGPVVGEIARILKPGGAFAAVIPTLRKPTRLFRECAGVLKTALAEERHDLAAISGHAVPLGSVDDLRRVFPSGDWASEAIRTCDIDVSIAAAPEALVEAVAPAFYNYSLLSAESRQRVAAKWTELFRAQCDDAGLARFHFPLSAFLVVRR